MLSAVAARDESGVMLVRDAAPDLYLSLGSG